MANKNNMTNYNKRIRNQNERNKERRGKSRVECNLRCELV
jgi:hypothetical protein